MTYLLASAAEGQTKVLLTLFLMLVTAKLMAEIFERLRQPPVVGDCDRHQIGWLRHWRKGSWLEANGSGRHGYGSTGEVGIVVAQIGLGIAVINDS